MLVSVPNLAAIESIDSAKLADKLNTAAGAAGRSEPLEAFIQVIEPCVRFVAQQMHCSNITSIGLTRVARVAWWAGWFRWIRAGRTPSRASTRRRP